MSKQPAEKMIQQRLKLLSEKMYDSTKGKACEAIFASSEFQEFQSCIEIFMSGNIQNTDLEQLLDIIFTCPSKVEPLVAPSLMLQLLSTVDDDLWKPTSLIKRLFALDKSVLIGILNNGLAFSLQSHDSFFPRLFEEDTAVLMKVSHFRFNIFSNPSLMERLFDGVYGEEVLREFIIPELVYYEKFTFDLSRSNRDYLKKKFPFQLFKPLAKIAKPTDVPKKFLAKAEVSAAFSNKEIISLRDKIDEVLILAISNPLVKNILEIVTESDVSIIFYKGLKPEFGDFGENAICIYKVVKFLEGSYHVAELMDTIIHECLHAALSLIYNNHSNPFVERDDPAKEDWSKITDEIIKQYEKLPLEEQSLLVTRYDPSEYISELPAFYMGALTKNLVQKFLDLSIIASKEDVLLTHKALVKQMGVLGEVMKYDVGVMQLIKELITGDSEEEASSISQTIMGYFRDYQDQSIFVSKAAEPEIQLMADEAETAEPT